jgi:RNA polymerase sigma-70 factor, ECF subfamily
VGEFGGPSGRGQEILRQTSAIRERFDTGYAQHSREVWSVAYARRMDADAAQDVMQETFLRYWTQLERGEVIQNPRAWLLRVARNLSEDQAKSAFRRHGTQPPEMLNGLVSGVVQPLDEMDRDEVFTQIRSLLDELPMSDREILTLRYALEYDAPHIAEVLGIAVTAVHMRLSRARIRLAERLSAIGVTNVP